MTGLHRDLIIRVRYTVDESHLQPTDNKESIIDNNRFNENSDC